MRPGDQQIASTLSRVVGGWGMQAIAEERAACLRLGLDEYAGVSQAIRDAAVKKGWALSDGSYPIMNVAMLKAAATLAASGHGKVAAAKALIKRRAAQLGVKLASLPGFGTETAAEGKQMCPTCGGSGEVPMGYKG